MKGIQLTLEEKQLLVESLLFTASCDVCSDHTIKHRIEMINLAEKINIPDQKLHNIYIYSTNVIDDKNITETILKKFPNMPKPPVITD